ncbi:MAG: hypothetical protein EOP04_25900 [Proteobacteria bacterium]|nr:MAG: hypothetical protein EOP04_25900 [Pseudomonadota bacterium]
MNSLTAGQRWQLGQWGLAPLYFNLNDRQRYVAMANKTYKNLEQLRNGAPPDPVEEDVHPFLVCDIMTDPLFVKTVTSRHNYLNHLNTLSGSPFSKVASLFAVYLLTNQWTAISS